MSRIRSYTSSSSRPLWKNSSSLRMPEVDKGCDHFPVGGHHPIGSVLVGSGGHAAANSARFLTLKDETNQARPCRSLGSRRIS